MTTQAEALQQAKEALIKGYKDGIYTPKQIAEALDALAALATVSDAQPVACGGRENCSRFPFCGCGAEPPFPERDASKPAEQQGFFRKFDVRRADGSDRPGGKHCGCRYYVLDLDHDKHAPAAMRAYATACKETHPNLAADIESEFAASPAPDVRPSVQPDSEGTSEFDKGWLAGLAAATGDTPVSVQGVSELTDEKISEATQEIYLSDFPSSAEYDIAIVRAALASQPAAPVQQEPDNDVGTDYECSACGKLNYRPNGCGNCGLEYEDVAPAQPPPSDQPELDCIEYDPTGKLVSADVIVGGERVKMAREAAPAVPVAAQPQEAGQARELPPPSSLPTWTECSQIIENHEFRLRAAEGTEGQVLDTPPTTPEPTALHRFIYEYDDGNRYRSAWFMHRLELALKECATAQAAPSVPELSDDEIVRVLHSLGIDTYPSKYGFSALQVSATSVPYLREVIKAFLTAAPSAPPRDPLQELADQAQALDMGYGPKGGWWVMDSGDLHPSRPILFRLIAKEPTTDAGGEG